MRALRKTFIFSILLFFNLIGCKKEDEYFKASGIKGEWVWIESVGGIGGWTLTPASEGIMKKLIIDDFKYMEYVNDSLVLETEYELGMSDESLLGTEEKTFIRFESGREQAILVSDSELVLIDQCFDCYGHRYNRK